LIDQEVAGEFARIIMGNRLERLSAAAFPGSKGAAN
jgi:hypothetical protein